jgi:hypothetical protein
MKRFPITIVDDFYENPELVRDFALSQTFYPSTGHYPGKRTSQLCNLNQQFFNNFCEKLFSLFYDFNTNTLEWNVETTFQKIGKLSENKESKFNVGWIHKDPVILSGIIYLSEDSVGTNIYYPIDPNGNYNDLHRKERDIFYSGGDVDEDEYSKSITEINSKFQESVRIDGKFNRLVLFEGGVYHGVPSFYCNNEYRLTQVFFVYKIDVVGDDMGKYPIVRSKVR